MNDNPCRTPLPPQQALHAPRMPELFGPRPDRYLQPVKLKFCNDVRVPRPKTFPPVPAHIMRRRLADIFEILEDPCGPWVHVGEFLLEIPPATRNEVIRRIATSMLQIERKTGWRMPPENFCGLVGDVPQHIKIWLTDKLSPCLGLEAFSFFLARSHREALIAGKFTIIACDRDFPEVTALYGGPEAVRAYAANGGTFSTDLGHTGQSLAHIAAQSTYQWPDAVAAFIAAGGNFHDQPDRFGRIPALTLVSEAGTPDAIRMTAEAGARITATLAVQPDRFGATLVSSAAMRGPEFSDAVAEWLSLEAGRS